MDATYVHVKYLESPYAGSTVGGRVFANQFIPPSTDICQNSWDLLGKGYSYLYDAK